jgi:ABC-type branched-subunit amino acid transport system ATPase component
MLFHTCCPSGVIESQRTSRLLRATAITLSAMTVTLLFGAWTESRPPRGWKRPSVEGVPEQGHNVYLLANETWNDYGYRTDFVVDYLHDGAWRSLGSISIGYTEQPIGTHTFEALGRPDSLTSFPPTYFGLGQDIDFYERLLTLAGREGALEILAALRDVATDPSVRSIAEKHDVYSISLLRSNGALGAIEQVPALFNLDNNVQLTEAFDADIWLDGADAPHKFHFDFGAQATVASQINVLVGLNGTGKTESMATLARLLTRMSLPEQATQVRDRSEISPRPSIYSVLAISFSAFDDFVIPKLSLSEKFKYTYCGLRSLNADTQRSEVGEVEVADRFSSLSLDDRATALEALESSLDEEFDTDAAIRSGDVEYEYLSAGQRIVLSIACDLLANVSNRTLVLMDEPELHLHPQLLSHLLRYVNNLLIERNSFAIIATHSPIVVQQVPSRSVQIVRRAGRYPTTSRPSIQTFGANLTEIVREVFEDKTADSAYQEVLQRMLASLGSADEVKHAFDGSLGLNAEIFLRSISASL